MNRPEEERITRITLHEAKKRGLQGKTNWKRVDSLTDEQIEEAVRNDPDAAPLVDKAFWEDAEIFNPSEKVEVQLHLDKRVLDYFKRGGRDYRMGINAALRALVDRLDEKFPS